jgi:HEAT repeat protein
MTSSPNACGIARIVSAAPGGAGEKQIGMAFVVDSRHVMTCCHVVNDALGRDRRDPAQPPSESRFAIRFPYADNAGTVGKVVKWGFAFPRPVDVAVLELEETPPPTAGIAVLSDAEVRGEKWSCSGWNQKGEQRVTQGEIADLLARNELQLNGPMGVAMRIVGGYSGAPVWAEGRKAFVGMVVSTDKDHYENWIAYAIPTSVLGEVWPELPRGSDGGSSEAFSAGLVEELIGDKGYLDALAAVLSCDPWLGPRGDVGFFESFHIQVRVGSRRNPERDGERERQRRAGPWIDEAGQAYAHPADVGRFSGAELRPWRGDGTPGLSARERFAWAVLLGDPGMGKTTLLKYEGWLSAREQIESIRQGRLRMNDVMLPVYVRLTDLAERTGESDPVETLAGLATDLRWGGVPVSAALGGLMRQKLRCGQVMLLLDALDEVPSGRYEGLVRWLQGWARAYPPRRLYITSRLVGYRGTPVALRDGAELELVAFTETEVRRFVSAYFGDAVGVGGLLLGDDLWGQLSDSPAVLGLAQTPLLLTLMCAAFQQRARRGSHQLPSTRCELYKECLDGLLGRWPALRRGIPPPDLADDDSFSARRRLLAEVCWRLAGSDPGRTLFSAEEIRQALGECRPLLDDLGWSVPEARKRFGQQYGVLIRTGSGEDARFLFLHRGFQEYLLACALAEQEGWLAAALGRVYDPTWGEILILLGGVLRRRGRNASAGGQTLAEQYVLALLRENANDVLCRPLLLAGRSAGEAADGIPERLSGQLGETLLALCLEGADFLDGPTLLTALAATGLRDLGPLRSFCEHKNAGVRCRAIEALGCLSRREAGAVGVLLKAAFDTHKWVRVSAHDALRGFRREKEIREALAAALGSEDDYVRDYAARAVGVTGCGSVESVAFLKEMLRSPDNGMRRRGAFALGGLRPPDQETLRSLMVALRDEDVGVRCNAAEALGKLGQGGAEVVRALEACFHDDFTNEGIRPVAADALGELARTDPEAVEVLVALLRDDDSKYQLKAAVLLCEAGQATTEAKARLLRLLRHREPSTRAGACEALGRFGPASAEVVANLLEDLRDEDMRVQKDAALALGRLRPADPGVGQALTSAFLNRGGLVRCSAAQALLILGREIPDAVTHLERDLIAGDSETRSRVAWLLNHLARDHPEAVTLLRSLLEDSDEKVRRAARNAFARVGHRQKKPVDPAFVPHGSRKEHTLACRLSTAGDPIAANGEQREDDPPIGPA